MFIKEKKLFLNLILPVFSALAVAGLAFAAWSEPSAAPPNNNVDAPINVSSNSQTFVNSKTLFVRSNGTGVIDLRGGLGLTGIFEIANNAPKVRLAEEDTTNMDWSIANNAGILRFQLTDDNGSNASSKMLIASDGDVGIGITGTNPAQKLDVGGQIHASGDICTDAGSGKCLSTIITSGFVGATPNTYNGQSVGGYTGGDSKCASVFSGSRMCAAGDFANGRPNTGGWYNTFILEKGSSANDCDAWTSNGSRGMHWLINGSDAENEALSAPPSGKPDSDPCSSKKAILCCK